MRLKEYFKVSREQKITEKYLRRVLLGSICGILLCMSCLAGTTWAWYVVGIENTENVIQIGPDITVALDNQPFVEKVELKPKEDSQGYIVNISCPENEDDLGKKSSLYVYFTVIKSDGTCKIYYTEVTAIEMRFEFNGADGMWLTWGVSWIEPSNNMNVVLITDQVIHVYEEVESEDKMDANQDTDQTPGDDSGMDDETDKEDGTDSDQNTNQDQDDSNMNDDTYTDEVENSGEGETGNGEQVDNSQNESNESSTPGNNTENQSPDDSNGDQNAENSDTNESDNTNVSDDDAAVETPDET